MRVALEFHHVAAGEFLTPAGFDGSIEPYLAPLDHELGLAAGLDQSVQFQELIQANLP